MKSSSKKAFIQTIAYAPWFLAFFSLAFFGLCLFERPSYLVLLFSIPFGLYTAFLLPCLWHRNNEWLGSLLTVLPAVYFSIWHSNPIEAVQTVLAAAAVTSFVWLLFKDKFMGCMSNNT
ncbi:hypothetical protein Q3O59_06860 [Alkalimonas delamerensis]|uniref:SPW repeat-containing protein n=1 Tax=Alkalimonas delamerensis TaxID=265981 RepID=A0ABT9GP60_9GAMM|nr:hypothetical protein [Alkalimonas delamerensis]MDP4528752.1 hypothetical protein [Alkalimonas delamerensis]